MIEPSSFEVPAARASSSSQWCVCLVSASPVLKTPVNVRRITRLIEDFDVAERPYEDWSRVWPNILTVLVDRVSKVDCDNRLVHLAGRPDRPLKYGRICMATGGVPRTIVPSHPLVLTLRDTESVAQFRSRLSGARRVVLVGNGGIATEVVYEIEDCQVLWIVKHENIAVPFLDAAASQFLLQNGLAKQRKVAGESRGDDGKGRGSKTTPMVRILRHNDADHGASNPAVQVEEVSRFTGSALGPDWARDHCFTGLIEGANLSRPIKVVYKCQVDQILSPSEFAESGETAIESDSEGPLLPQQCPTTWPLYVRLSNGECYGADFVISATGVEANVISSVAPSTTPSAPCAVLMEAQNGIAMASAVEGGGLVVNETMQSSVPEVYAAGDCAFADWQPKAPHWFQMRLWSQARQTAFQAAKSMFYHTINEEVPLDFSFEIFTHVTRFFGFKVVLLGLFNGQGLDMTSPEVCVLLRITPGEEYVKCIMRNGRMQGALLIGETDLEETFENLILSQLDLTQFGEHLLDPSIDLSDYFE